MGQLTQWWQGQRVLALLFELLDTEILGTLANARRNLRNYTDSDLIQMVLDLTALHGTFANLSRSSIQRDSAKGEMVFPAVYGGTQKRVDVLTRCAAGQYRLTECKFGIKPGGSRPFTDPSEFSANVAQKFDDDLALLAGDGENASPLRIVVVEDGHFNGCLSAIRMLEQACQGAPGTCSTDGHTHDYALCTCSALRQLLDAPSLLLPMAGKLAYFRL